MKMIGGNGDIAIHGLIRENIDDDDDDDDDDMYTRIYIYIYLISSHSTKLLDATDIKLELLIL